MPSVKKHEQIVRFERDDALLQIIDVEHLAVVDA